MAVRLIDSDLLPSRKTVWGEVHVSLFDSVKGMAIIPWLMSTDTVDQVNDPDYPSWQIARRNSSVETSGSKVREVKAGHKLCLLKGGLRQV